MGCTYSVIKQRNQRRATELEAEEQRENELCDISDAGLIGMKDQETINVIKKDLNESPEMFVLNNVLMCTMFLRNYQEEIYQVIQQLDKAKDESQPFWEPDTMMERANRHVIYRPIHGHNKDIAVPLVTRRIYVPLNECLDVHNPMDDEEDSNEDNETNGTSKYKVKIEESKRQGYVKLQRLNGGNYNDGNSLKDILTVPSSNTSGSSDTESTGTTSTGLPLQEHPQLIKNQPDAGTLDDCFVFRKVKKPDIDLEMEDMDHENLTEDDIYDIVSYLPSRKFMKYFQSKLFKDSIAEKLGLVEYEIDNAIVDEHIPGKIFCNLKDDNGNNYPVEVVPCLKSSWPSKQTYKFLEGYRPCDEEDDDDAFQWPTEDMLREIKNLECALVPKGYTKRRGEYPEGDLDWEIHFPQAESYLENLLRPEQIKCYLILLTIYKEYLEPFTKRHGVIPEHFLNLIFWESENNYDAWPEHRLGIRLISIISNFSENLSQRCMRDYFVRRKNVLKNVSRRCLELANEIFYRIKESPVMLIIRALRNIRYTNSSFYPPLDYKELLDILYKKDWEEKQYLSDLSLNYVSSDAISIATTTTDKKPKFADAEKQLEWLKQREKRRKLIKKKQEVNNVKKLANLRYTVHAEARRESTDTVDDNWECEKRFEFQKKIALLKFFINNYIDIAKTCQKIGSTKQAMFYLKQAWYLTKILEEENRLFTEETTEFFRQIEEEEDKVINAMHTNLTNNGSLEVLNPNVSDEAELAANLASLDDVFHKADDSKQLINNNNSNQVDVDPDIHQQVRHTQINLKSLSKSFSRSYSYFESTENVR